MVRAIPIILALASLAFRQTGLSVAAIDERVEKWQPTQKEKAWERIAWAVDIRDALRRAETAGRPVFLFTHDGRLGIGRC